jgi:hypothetical protein
MRIAVLLAAAVLAAPAEKRHGIEPDLKTYPQASAREALTSVLKAVESKRIDYLMAHLADPQFVDQRLKENGNRFDELVKEASAKLVDDPGAVKQLRRFLSDGEWKIADTSAAVRLKDVSDRQVFLRKSGDRWFLENRRRPEPPAKK